MSKSSRFTLKTEEPLSFVVANKKDKDIEAVLVAKRVPYSVERVKTKPIVKVLAFLLVAVIIGGAVFAVLSLFKKDAGKNDLGISSNRFEGLGLPPSGVSELPLYEIPQEDDEEGHKMLALKLYEKANQLDLEVEARLVLNSCPTLNDAMGMVNYIDLDIVEIKNKTQYFRCDYRLKNSIPLFDIPPFNTMAKELNNYLDLVLTERRYYDTSMEVMKYQKVKNAYVEDGIPFAYWHKDVTELDLEPPVFRVDQGKEYEKFEHKLDLDTMKTAVVRYDAEHKIYKVELSLDIDNPKTTEKKLQGVKEGTGDENAHFTRLDVSFEVFSSGYYRKFSYFEIWEAKTFLSIAVRGEFDNNEVFSYSKKDCDLKTYWDSKDFIASLSK